VKLGIVGFQGDVEEHLEMFTMASQKTGLDLETVKIRRKEDLSGVNGIVIPGGESTTIFKLTKEYKIYDEISRMVLENNIAFMGTCAGLILSSSDTSDERVHGMGLLDVKILRNGYGRQADSFIREIDIEGIFRYPAVFIRAPVIKETGSCKIMAYDHGTPVMVRSGNRLGMTFHPELTGDTRIHEYFLKLMEGGGSISYGNQKIKVGMK
jgi:5'-phosphate synthase pdxT subunit